MDCLSSVLGMLAIIHRYCKVRWSESLEQRHWEETTLHGLLHEIRSKEHFEVCMWLYTAPCIYSGISLKMNYSTRNAVAYLEK